MRSLLIAASLTFIAGQAAAQEIKVNTGQWETETTFNTSITMNGTTQQMPGETESASECWASEAQATLKPSMLSIDGCDVLNPSVFNNELKFDMTCNIDGVAMTGDATITVAPDKNSTHGTINMLAQMEGVTVNASGTLIGKRTGSCS